MTSYFLSIENPNQQYIRFRVEMPVSGTETTVQLPKWRPGRYELGNFAKNVRNFRIFGSDGKALPFQKEGSSSWKVEHRENEVLRIEYAYYAAELNAGSTFLSADQLYANPVNCFVYDRDNTNAACEVHLAVPEDWKIACGLEREGQKLLAPDYDTLADSPFICSPDLQYNQYEAGGTVFHLWFNGAVDPDWTRLVSDFKKFSEAQIARFMEFPVPHYHFLFQILPFKAYHGVEHRNSTVIALGPSYEVFGDLYNELLGVSSHELYHTWNVKAIRPAEMFPYDYQRENFSKLGYLCEGVTTYMGDLMLYKAGVFTVKDYLREMTAQLQKHFDNFGRFNLSVADSSWDTWLDGYVPGAPGRKTSIYTEGCLLAFVTDIMIRRNSGDKYGIDEVMKRLYYNFAAQNKGVTEQDYQDVVISLAGEEMKDIFRDYFYGTRPYEGILADAFEYIGIELLHKPAASYAQGRTGMKALQEGKTFIVKALFPGGPADLGGLMLEDEIIAVNNFALNGDLDKWLKFCDDAVKTITVIRAGRLREFILPEVQRSFYLEYGLRQVESPNAAQKKAFEHWSK
jgi:predicted metalloprotease with PDZ domain